MGRSGLCAGPEDFKRRIRETNTEDGAVMETVLAYAMDQAYTSSRRTLLSEHRNSEKYGGLIERGVLQLDARDRPDSGWCPQHRCRLRNDSSAIRSGADPSARAR